MATIDWPTPPLPSLTPLQRLEKIVIDALTARGMTEAEARNIIDKLKGFEVSKFNGKEEIEVKGDLVALNPVNFRARLPKSIAVVFRGAEHIIPFSQIPFGSELDADSNPGDIGILVITKWLAQKKGIIP